MFKSNWLMNKHCSVVKLADIPSYLGGEGLGKIGFVAG